jgi:hypothetical protein
MTLKTIHQAALNLPREERGKLAAALLSSLDGENELERIWVEEAERRFAAFQRGETKATPAREAIAAARAALKR